jgi:hypothetical protein
MITKFEKFELFDDDFDYDDQKKYWKVKTDEPYLELSLNVLKDKYGCTLEFIPDLVNSYFGPNYTKDNIYIGSINMDEKIWNWAEDTEFFNINHVKFMGNFKIPKKYWNEYKLKKTADKYNF